MKKYSVLCQIKVFGRPTKNFNKSILYSNVFAVLSIQYFQLKSVFSIQILSKST